jgi:hypothetical protein
VKELRSRYPRARYTKGHPGLTRGHEEREGELTCDVAANNIGSIR